MLVLANAPGALAVGVVLAALPVGPVIAAFLWLDRYEPEPVRLLVLGVLWGASSRRRPRSCCSRSTRSCSAPRTTGRPRSSRRSPRRAPRASSSCCCCGSGAGVIDGVLDGIVYAGLVGVGFAFTENILYLARRLHGQ